MTAAPFTIYHSVVAVPHDAQGKSAPLPADLGTLRYPMLGTSRELVYKAAVNVATICAQMELADLNLGTKEWGERFSARVQELVEGIAS